MHKECWNAGTLSVYDFYFKRFTMESITPYTRTSVTNTSQPVSQPASRTNQSIRQSTHACPGLAETLFSFHNLNASISYSIND
jgi:hypothetical protein